MTDAGARLVARVVEAWNGVVKAGVGDDAAAAALTELLEADVTWISPPRAVEPGTRQGTDAFVGAIFSMVDAFGPY